MLKLREGLLHFGDGVTCACFQRLGYSPDVSIQLMMLCIGMHTSAIQSSDNCVGKLSVLVHFDGSSFLMGSLISLILKCCRGTVYVIDRVHLDILPQYPSNADVVVIKR